MLAMVWAIQRSTCARSAASFRFAEHAARALSAFAPSPPAGPPRRSASLTDWSRSGDNLLGDRLRLGQSMKSAGRPRPSPGCGRTGGEDLPHKGVPAVLQRHAVLTSAESRL